MPHKSSEDQAPAVDRPAPLADTTITQVCESWTVTLYIGGCITTAKAALARHAAEHADCWSVEPTVFVYSGGQEAGMVIRRIAYARFPCAPEDAEQRLLTVGLALMHELGQGSFSVVGPERSVYVSRRRFG